MMESDQLTLFVAGSHASRLALQESKEARMILGIYGRKCSDLLKNCALGGLSVKMCRDSSTWASTKFALIWKVKITPFKRTILVLSAKMLDTNEKDYGLLHTPTKASNQSSPSELEKGSGYDLWATPNTMDHIGQRSYEAMKKQAKSGGRKNRRRPSNLREQVDPIMCQAYTDAKNENALWPTPNAWDGNRGPVKSGIKWVNGSCKRVSQTTGTEFSASLVTAVDSAEKKALWATPNASDSKQANHKNGHDEVKGYLRGDPRLWSTPTTQDSNKAVKRWRDDFQNNLTAEVFNPDKLNKSPNLSADKAKYHLNPDWVEGLMGYPIGWTNLQVDNVSHDLDEFVGDPDTKGVPRVTDSKAGRANRLKQLGNSIVPQVAEGIFKHIRGIENEMEKELLRKYD